MDVIDDLTKANLRQETILTIGAFDGVHLGHQVLIRGVVARARKTDRLAALITFHPHPAVVLAWDRAPRYLTTPGEKVALLEKLGMDLVVLLPFDREVADTPASDFMEQVVAYLRIRELWVGADFALGRGREGDVPRLQELGRDLGYSIRVCEPVRIGGEVVSSSRIRALLAEGRVAEAARLLGHYPSLSGKVVMGAERGHSLGFPTANLEVRPERAVPANGVYAVFALLGTQRYPAVANVGVRPSFNNPLTGTESPRTIETHIFDFDQDIYGCDLVVEFVVRLRDERRFKDIDGLVAQIERDGVEAKHILSGKDSALVAGGLQPSPCRYRYRELEHTADLALEVWGAELPDLFAGAAEGMYSLMGDVGGEGLEVTEWHEISLEASDLEILLVDWLNELLFLAETEGLLLVDFRIDALGDRSSTDTQVA
ncbi:MAG: riboflavin biosynthesis protein RibF, partial [Anaerolineae bacterium]